MSKSQIEGLRIAVAVTGASGSIYAQKLVQFLADVVPRVYLLSTTAGAQVAKFELTGEAHSSAELNLSRLMGGEVPEKYRSVIRVLNQSDLFAPIASGTSAPDAMVVVPASMGTVARIAHGLSSNLLERAADVVLKEKRKLIVVPRETPLSTIHLENLLALSKLGVHIIPAMPAFYNHPKSIDDQVDFIVGRILDAVDVSHDLYRRWNERMS